MDDPWQNPQLVAEVRRRYGVEAAVLERLPASHNTVTSVLASLRGRLHLVQYLTEERASAAVPGLSMSAFCHVAQVPAPQVICDSNHQLVSQDVLGQCALRTQPPGIALVGALTAAQAEQLGVRVAHMHQALRAFLSSSKLECVWPAPNEKEVLARLAARAETVRPGASSQQRADLGELLSKRRQDLERWTATLQQGMPTSMQLQPVHGALSASQVVAVTDLVTGIVGFRACSAPRAWEVAQLAFDAVTVSSTSLWPAIALNLLGSYQKEFPLAAEELQACARIAALHVLTAVPPCPSNRAAAFIGELRTQQVAVTRLIQAMPQMDRDLSDLAARLTQRPV